MKLLLFGLLLLSTSGIACEGYERICFDENKDSEQCLSQAQICEDQYIQSLIEKLKSNNNAKVLNALKELKQKNISLEVLTPTIAENSNNWSVDIILYLASSEGFSFYDEDIYIDLFKKNQEASASLKIADILSNNRSERFINLLLISTKKGFYQDQITRYDFEDVQAIIDNLLLSEENLFDSLAKFIAVQAGSPFLEEKLLLGLEQGGLLYKNMSKVNLYVADNLKESLWTASYLYEDQHQFRPKLKTKVKLFEKSNLLPMILWANTWSSEHFRIIIEEIPSTKLVMVENEDEKDDEEDEFQEVESTLLFDLLDEVSLTEASVTEVLKFFLSNENNHQNQRVASFVKKLDDLSESQLNLLVILAEKVFASIDLVSFYEEQFKKSSQIAFLESAVTSANAEKIKSLLLYCDINEEPVNFWPVLNERTLSRDEVLDGVELYVLANKQSGQATFGQFEQYALETMPYLILERVLKINDRSINNKIVRKVITGPLKTSLSLTELKEIENLVANSSVSPSLKARLSIVISNIDELNNDLFSIDTDIAESIETYGLEKVLVSFAQHLKSLDLGSVDFNLLNKINGIDEYMVDRSIDQDRSFIRQRIQLNEIEKHAITKSESLAVQQICEADEASVLCLLANIKQNRKLNHTNLLMNYIDQFELLRVSHLGILKHILQTKYYLALVSKSALNKLSRSELLRIPAFFSKAQQKLHQFYVESDLKDISRGSTGYTVANGNVFQTENNYAVTAPLICSGEANCLYFFNFDNNHSFLTNIYGKETRAPDSVVYPQGAQFPNAMGQIVYAGAVESYLQKDISFNGVVNDVLIIDVSIASSSIPGQPFKGTNGVLPQRVLVTYKQEECRNWADWGFVCLSHHEVTKHRCDTITHGRAPSPGVNGVDGVKSGDVYLSIRSNKEYKPFAKVFVFNSSGDGGAGAIAGDEVKQNRIDMCTVTSTGKAPGGNGKQGYPGEIGSVTVNSNPNKVEVIEIGVKGKGRSQ